ncbi:MAG: DoxX family protein [Alphaproteobacteria bacterium]|nr:MAG: DoxX family protein [Alphaproteobacteria bacterium]
MDLTNRLPAFAGLLGRILLSLIFIFTGLGKIAGGSAETIAYMQAHGLSPMLFWPSALFEFLAGIAILLGVGTRGVALLLAGFCLLTAFWFHRDFTDQMQMVLFMKNLGLAGGFLMLVRCGAGEYSIDAWKFRESDR